MLESMLSSEEIASTVVLWSFALIVASIDGSVQRRLGITPRSLTRRIQLLATGALIVLLAWMEFGIARALSAGVPLSALAFVIDWIAQLLTRYRRVEIAFVERGIEHLVSRNPEIAARYARARHEFENLEQTPAELERLERRTWIVVGVCVLVGIASVACITLSGAGS